MFQEVLAAARTMSFIGPTVTERGADTVSSNAPDREVARDLIGELASTYQETS